MPDDNIIEGVAAPVHADGHAALFQWRQRLRRRKLRTLIRFNSNFGLEAGPVILCSQH
jgi:hypothetical protein